MNNFNFGEVLTRAWKNIWNHKVLWIFGILASCARSGGGSGGSGSRSSYNFPSDPSGNTPFSGGEMERVMNQVGRYIEQHLPIIIAIVVVLILISFISYALGMMGRIGLIRGNYKIEHGSETLSFGELWSESMPFFGRIFGLNFLIGLAFLIILVPLVLLGVVTAGVGFICVLPLICILIPVGWVLSVVIEQAQAAIVLENLGMLDGFKRGWQIVKSNPAPMIVIALILLVGGGVLGVIVALPIIFAVLPVMVGATQLRQSLTPAYIALACCLAYMPVLILFNGVLTAYIQSVWALTYLRLTAPREDTPLVVEANA